jgi:REP element-mobilizing transposase RayT
MPQSLAQIYVHLVFSTKDRVPQISEGVQPRLYAYLAGACSAIHCEALVVGGVADHVHLLFRLARTTCLSDAVKDIKVESSKWMKTDAGIPDFAWQAGYGAFSIGASQVSDVMDYICRQAEHHAKRGFQEEFRLLLKRYGVKYDEAYVWD